MIKMLINFVALTLILWGLFEFWDKASKREKKLTLQNLGLAAIFSGLSVVILSIIVIFF